MPFVIPQGDDAIFGWKESGGGGGNPNFHPPGTPGAGGGFGGGSGSSGFFGLAPYNFNAGGFGSLDPVARRRLAMAFNKRKPSSAPLDNAPNMGDIWGGY